MGQSIFERATMDQLIIDIDESGKIRYIATPELQLGGETRRVSHVLPVNPVLRLAFRLLRWFGDEGRAAEFTRSWPCMWSAEIIGGPKLGEFSSRSEAIAAEVEWVNANLL